MVEIQMYLAALLGLAAALTAGVAFAVPQFLISNFHGPWLVDIVAAVCSIGGDRGAADILEAAAERRGGFGWDAHEGSIPRYVFFHRLALAALVGILVFLQAYVFPFTQMVVK